MLGKIRNISYRMRFIAPALLLAAGAACGSNRVNDNVDHQIQEPSNPTGSIVGRIVDAQNNSALAGVTVMVYTVSSGGALTEVEATSNADGVYALIGIPAGTEYAVYYSLTGYATRIVDVYLTDSAGQFPQGNVLVEVDMEMYAANATIAGVVMTASGTPAQGAVVSIDLRGNNVDFVATATTDAQGNYSLSGVPALNQSFRAYVWAFDADSDGLHDYYEQNRWVAPYPGMTTTADFILNPMPIYLVGTDIVNWEHPADSPLHFTFNRPVDLAGSAFWLWDDSEIAVSLALDATGKQLIVSPAGATSLPVGQWFEFEFDVRATNGATTDEWDEFFTIAAPYSLGDVTGLTIAPSVGDWDTRQYTLYWDPMPGALGFTIYARDDAHNPTFVQLGSASAGSQPSYGFTLPDSFDARKDDGWIIPLTDSTSVSFAVVPYDAYYRGGDLMAATTASVADGIAPSIVDIFYVGTANNSVNSNPAQLAIYIGYSEFMASGVTPTLTLPAGCSSYTYTQDPSDFSGVFRITVPGTTDCRGDFTISGHQDSSGNAMESFTETFPTNEYVLLYDDFEAGAISSAWNTLSGDAAVTSDYAGAGMSSLNLGGGGGIIESDVFDTSGCGTVTWMYNINECRRRPMPVIPSPWNIGTAAAGRPKPLTAAPDRSATG